MGGSPDGRGVVATCSYEARRFGVRNAMPMAQALRLCPELVVLRTRMDKYKEASEAVQSIFRRFTDRIEPLPLTKPSSTSRAPCYSTAAPRVAEAIRRAVREEQGLTVSAGVAPNKFLAKIASDWRKPDGLFVLKPDEVDAFVRRLPVEKLFGVGPRTAEKLHRLGLRSCEDLRTLDLPTLTERFGVFGKRLFDLAGGGIAPRAATGSESPSPWSAPLAKIWPRRRPAWRCFPNSSAPWKRALAGKRLKRPQAGAS